MDATRPRRRTRRALTSLAALAVLAGATACGDAGAPGSAGDPAPSTGDSPATVSETTASDDGTLTEVPADFPLDEGLPADNGDDGSPVEVVDRPGWDDVELCDAVVWSPDAPVPTTDVAGAIYTGEAEDVRSRTLAVYADADAAADAFDRLREGIASCPDGETGGTEQVYEEVSGDESSATFTHRYRTDGRFDTGLEVIQAVRRGNALFLAGYYGEGGGSEDTIASSVELAAEESAGVVDALVVFEAAAPEPSDVPEPGETDSPDPADPTGTPSAEDLSDLPLLTGWPEDAGDGKGLEGPGAGLDPVYFEPCGVAPDSAAATSRIHSAYSNAEDYRRRTLLVFDTADDAVAYVADARAVVAACPSDPFGENQATAWSIAPTRVGGESFAAYSIDTYDGAPGIHQVAVHVVRLGRAVLLDGAYNEGGNHGIDDSRQALVDAIVAAQAPVVTAMCRFTEAGC